MVRVFNELNKIMAQVVSKAQNSMKAEKEKTSFRNDGEDITKLGR